MIQFDLSGPPSRSMRKWTWRDVYVMASSIWSVSRICRTACGSLTLGWYVISWSLGKGGGWICMGQSVARASLMVEPCFSSFGLSWAVYGFVSWLKGDLPAGVWELIGRRVALPELRTESLALGAAGLQGIFKGLRSLLSNRISFFLPLSVLNLWDGTGLCSYVAFTQLYFKNLNWSWLEGAMSCGFSLLFPFPHKTSLWIWDDTCFSGGRWSVYLSHCLVSHFVVGITRITQTCCSAGSWVMFITVVRRSITILANNGGCKHLTQSVRSWK